MAYQVAYARRSRREVRAIQDWLSDRSPRGAARWLQALRKTTKRLEENPLTCALADEEELARLDIRQVLFKTIRGKFYRVLFEIEGETVRILHVRGPGQAPLTSDDVGEA